MQTQRSHSRPDVNFCNSWDILHIQKSPEASNKTCVRLSLKQIPPNVSLDSFHTRACPLGILAREPRWRDVTNLSAPRILSKNAVQSRVWLWHGSYGGPDSWCDECELCVHMCGFQQLAKAHPWEDNLELVSHKIVIDKSINPYRNPFCASELDDLVPQIRTTSMVDMFWQKVLAKFLSSSFQFFGLHQAIWFYTRITTWNLGDFFLGDLTLSWHFTVGYESWSNKNGGFFVLVTDRSRSASSGYVSPIVRSSKKRRVEVPMMGSGIR